MIIEPRVRGFICTTAHPVGCATNVREQIAYVLRQGSIPDCPKRVAVLGCSTGYGLAFQKMNTKDLGGGDLQDEVYAAKFLAACQDILARGRTPVLAQTVSSLSFHVDSPIAWPGGGG